MTEEEYKQEWLSGKHQSDYNDCRFTDNKLEYCKQWIKQNIPYANIDKPDNIVDLICRQKIKIAENEQYRNLCCKWADKIEVNNLLHDLNFDDIRIPVYYSGYGNLTEEIFNSLPNKKLIIKCNHGSGWNIVVDNTKQNINSKYIIEKINNWLSLNYSYITGYEAQYENIKPGVIIEPILVDQPTDYGFWCINGNIVGISLTRKIAKNIEEYIAFVNINGKQNPWYIGMKPAMSDLNKFQLQMVNSIIPYVKEIAKLFDIVRIDMYYVNGHVYFGETTFTPCSGRLIFNQI